jgi:hypothetical protein
MTSQVSFKFDGEHNKSFLLKTLKSKLKGFKYKIENENSHKTVFRIYVASLESAKKTFDVCFAIQCNVVYDSNRELK